jgi:hypothetical protein
MAKTRKSKPPACADCFFHQNLLCALQLGGPCSTFRAAGPDGLVPPRQPVLLMRPASRPPAVLQSISRAA